MDALRTFLMARVGQLLGSLPRYECGTNVLSPGLEWSLQTARARAVSTGLPSSEETKLSQARTGCLGPELHEQDGVYVLLMSIWRVASWANPL